MAKRLTENISSAYFEAANRLRAKSARRRIVAYVESYDDVFFWRTALSRHEDETRYFEVMLPSRAKLERGKKSALMSLIPDKVGRSMIACVDADYDYIMQGATPTSRQILDSPYVLHTYAYAIENYQCYAPSLHDTCVMVTLNDHAVFDFKEFMRLYSEAVFPLFVWSVWHYRRGIYKDFTITDFNKIIDIGGFNLNAPQVAIDNVRNKVRKKINLLQRHFPHAKESYLALKRELIKLGVTPQTTYMYIHGHHLFNKIVQPVVTKVCSRLIQERENEIRRQAKHGTQMRNELSCYSNSMQNIEQMMKRNTGYMVSEQFIRLQNDIKRFLEMERKASEKDNGNGKIE
ncbi:DUF4435 domain-containing protein [Prevotella sp. PCHR]|uniref:DUF4435 domain-containing protein n=1 Tax=Xylanibacter caecicola TaxID=2736294 RepID=A0ABX2B2E0_9BACT|nr:DUF4435 domain-containing protein [Xylanibacter caecicola]NPE24865.1 DUF4435 domain-containing protein [Xylanibacter caecicola]